MNVKYYIKFYHLADENKVTLKKVPSRKLENVKIPEQCYKFDVFSVINCEYALESKLFDFNIKKSDVKTYLVGRLLSYKQLKQMFQVDDAEIGATSKHDLFVVKGNKITPLKGNGFIDEAKINNKGFYSGEEVLNI